MIDLINLLGNGWMTYFGWAVIQNTIFLGLLFLALYLLRNTSARLKYTVTLIGLIKLLLPPFLPATFLSLSTSNINPVSTAIAIQPVSEIITKKIWVLEIKYAGWLFIIWMFFAVGSIFVSLGLTLRLKRRLKNAIEIDHQKLDLGNNTASIQILKSDKISIPLTLGIMPQKIYVPALWDQWSERCRRMIIQHELAHIKRKDGIVQFFQILTQAIYFFHPLVWQLSKRMNEFREMACDEISIENNSGLSVEYSRALVEIAENMVQTRLGISSASALIRQKNELLNRVQYLIREVKMHNASKLKIGLILAGLLVFIVPLSWMRAKPAVEEPPSPPPAQEEQKEYETPFMSFPEGGFEAIRKNLVYPEAARKAGLEGNVTVEVLFTEKGFKSASIKESSFAPGKDLGCHQAALDAIKSVRWSKVKGVKEAGGHMEIPLAFSLSPPPPPPDEDVVVFVPYDSPPEPIGGFAEIQKNLEYPEAARKAGTEGKVVLYVHISETGEVLKAKVQESVNPECDKAAIKAIQSVKWNPAKQGDDPVAVWVAVPISFKLH